MAAKREGNASKKHFNKEADEREIRQIRKRQEDVSVLQKRGKVCKIEFKMQEGERQCIPTTPGAFVRLRWR